jgi:23S rRNA (cytosine1962-C5)-methyltransferase
MTLPIRGKEEVETLNSKVANRSSSPEGKNLCDGTVGVLRRGGPHRRKLESGDTLAVRSSQGAFSLGCVQPASQIVARVGTADSSRIDRDFSARLQSAIETRKAVFGTTGQQAMRLVHGNRTLPGIVVDRYADLLVLQLTSAGLLLARHAGRIAARIDRRTSVSNARCEGLALEGLEPNRLASWLAPARPRRLRRERSHLPGRFPIRPQDRLLSRPAGGRAARLAAGREVLDCFCYTGAFTASMLAGGANAVTAMGSSAQPGNGSRMGN